MKNRVCSITIESEGAIFPLSEIRQLADESKGYSMRKWKWVVYILECLDGSYYVGRTWRIDLRVDQHMSGLGSKYTAKHGIKNLSMLKSMKNLKKLL